MFHKQKWLRAVLNDVAVWNVHKVLWERVPEWKTTITGIGCPSACGYKPLWIHRRAGVGIYKIFQIDWSMVLQS
jgi:hypothetical protein